jgi:LysW-gamma-L-lysine carboxypeptidase
VPDLQRHQTSVGDCRSKIENLKSKIVAVQLLEGLVRIPSVSGHEAAAVGYLVEQMQRLGFDSFVDGAGNAVGVIGEGRPETVLLGHIDTVPGEIPVRIENGRLWGRGTVDAKGPLATFAMAAARAFACGNLHGRIVVIGCVEEEAPSSRGAHYAVTRYRPAACIIGEPSGSHRVTLGYKGTLRIRCRAEAACGHGAHNRQTPSERVVLLWQQIRSHADRFNQGRERAFDQLLPTLIAVNSGSDGLHEWAKAEISVRLPLDVEPLVLAEQIRAFDLGIVIDVLGTASAFRAERTTPLVRAFTQAIRQHNQQPALVLKTGTADMNIVGPAWNCPIVAYGPGDAALDHTPDEHIVLDEYERGITVLERVLRTLHAP